MTLYLRLCQNRYATAFILLCNNENYRRTPVYTYFNMSTPTRRIPITSNKSNLFDFTKYITDFLDTELSSSTLKCPWKDTWLSLKNDNGFGTRKFTRFQLAKIIVGTDASDKSLTNIIKEIKNKFPPISQHFTFTPDANDTDLWIMTTKDTTDNKANSNDDEEDGWTKMPTSTSSKSNTMYETPDTKPTASTNKNAFTNSFASLAPTSPPDEDISFDSESTKQQSTLLCQDDINDENPTNTPEQDNTDQTESDDLFNENWTTESYIEVDNAIREGRIDDINDSNKLYYWINTSVESINVNTQSSIIKLTQHSHKLSTEMNSNIASIKKLTADAKSSCEGIVNKNDKEIKNITKHIQRSETDAISAINICANRRKEELQGKIDEVTNLTLLMEAKSSIPSDCLIEVNKTVHKLRNEIKTIYDEFEENTTDTIDTQKQDLRNWMTEFVKTNNVAAVRNLVEETKKLTAERMLMESKRHEIDSWFQSYKNQVPNPSVPTHETPTTTPPFLPDTAVTYKKGLCNVIGYIMNTQPILVNNKWQFDIYTINGTTVHNCDEDNITLAHDIMPPPGTDPSIHSTPPLAPPSPTRHAPFQHYHADTPPSTSPSPQKPWTYPTRRIAENEFEFPPGATPTSVNGQRLIKHAENWNFNLRNVLDLRGFYDQLQILLRPYSIHLKDYKDIVADHGLEAITSTNCTKYDIAVTQMSQTLMLFFQTYGTKIFTDYKDPLDYIAAFRATSNGLGFLKRIMKKRHPNLKDVINRTTPSAPEFKHHNNIHLFIQAYIEWIHDEQLRGGRTYDDKEKLDHVINNLDERFQIALHKIESSIDKLYADPFHPLPFPPQLQLSNELGMYITDLIPDDKKEDLTNTTPIIHAMTRSKYRSRQQDDKPSFDKKRNYPPRNLEQKGNNQWADKLEWKVLPGIQCPACKKNNHNVYSTGCPALSLFCACKDFYDKTPKEKLEPVKSAYLKYQKELGHKLRERRNNDRRTLRLLADNYNDDDVGEMKKLMFDKYKNDYDEEQYITENPYDDFYITEDENTPQDE